MHLSGVAEAVSISKPFKLASRETHPHDTIINIKTPTATVASILGGGTFGVIGGPCAVEGREQTLAAREVDSLLQSARIKLLAIRNSRIWPARDEKILTSWNALMIRGMALAARQS